MAYSQSILLNLTIEELKEIVSSCIKEALSYNDSCRKIPEHDKEIYYTRQQAAEALNVTLVTLRNRTKDRSLKSYRFGNRILYKESDIANSLKEVSFQSK